MKKRILLGIICAALLLSAGAWFFQSAVFVRSVTTRWLASCVAAQAEEKTTCIRHAIERALGYFGPDAALDALADSVDRDPSFGSSCHDFTHLIGKESYRQYIATESLAISKKTAYCSFGFYHGFMETLLSLGGTIEDARGLCALVDAQLGAEIPNAVAACYHGIGHGSVDIHNPSHRGNEHALIDPALSVCQSFAKDMEQLKICSTGVFDSLSLGYYNQENGLVMRQSDPLWLCRQQEGIVKEACYLDMMPAMLWLGEYDLAKAAPLVAAHTEAAYRSLAIKTVADGSIRHILGKKDPGEYLAVCRRLDASLQSSCVAGLGSGIMQFGKPEVEYADALAFCARDALTAPEQDACYQSVLSYVQGRYSQTKVQSICADVAEPYRKHCL